MAPVAPQWDPSQHHATQKSAPSFVGARDGREELQALRFDGLEEPALRLRGPSVGGGEVLLVPRVRGVEGLEQAPLHRLHVAAHYGRACRYLRLDWVGGPGGWMVYGC